MRVLYNSEYVTSMQTETIKDTKTDLRKNVLQQMRLQHSNITANYNGAATRDACARKLTLTMEKDQDVIYKSLRFPTCKLLQRCIAL